MDSVRRWGGRLIVLAGFAFLGFLLSSALDAAAASPAQTGGTGEREPVRCDRPAGPVLGVLDAPSREQPDSQRRKTADRCGGAAGATLRMPLMTGRPQSTGSSLANAPTAAELRTVVSGTVTTTSRVVGNAAHSVVPAAVRPAVRGALRPLLSAARGVASAVTGVGQVRSDLPGQNHRETAEAAGSSARGTSAGGAATGLDHGLTGTRSAAVIRPVLAPDDDVRTPAGPRRGYPPCPAPARHGQSGALDGAVGFPVTVLTCSAVSPGPTRGFRTRPGDDSAWRYRPARPVVSPD